MALKLVKEYAGVVYSPRREEIYSNGGGVLYPRPVELHHAVELDGVILAAFDHYTLQEPPVFPIYASRDHGRTWEFYSQVEDSKNGHGMGMCTIEDGSRLLQLAPTQCDPVLLQISYGIGNLGTE